MFNIGTGDMTGNKKKKQNKFTEESITKFIAD